MGHHHMLQRMNEPTDQRTIDDLANLALEVLDRNGGEMQIRDVLTQMRGYGPDDATSIQLLRGLQYAQQIGLVEKNGENGNISYRAIR